MDDSISENSKNEMIKSSQSYLTSNINSYLQIAQEKEKQAFQTNSLNSKLSTFK